MLIFNYTVYKLSICLNVNKMTDQEPNEVALEFWCFDWKDHKHGYSWFNFVSRLTPETWRQPTKAKVLEMVVCNLLVLVLALKLEWIGYNIATTLPQSPMSEEA